MSGVLVLFFVSLPPSTGAIFPVEGSAENLLMLGNHPHTGVIFKIHKQRPDQVRLLGFLIIHKIHINPHNDSCNVSTVIYGNPTQCIRWAKAEFN